MTGLLRVLGCEAWPKLWALYSFIFSGPAIDRNPCDDVQRHILRLLWSAIRNRRTRDHVRHKANMGERWQRCTQGTPCTAL